MKKIIRNFFNGLAFGITETVPGVSGGTIAIILGFYDELISAVNNFVKDIKKSLKLLVPLLIGAAAGILAFGSIINYLLKNYSFPTMTFFIGLIMGIIPIIYSKVKTPGRMFNLKEAALIIIPVILLFVISNVKNAIGHADPADTAKDIDGLYMLFIFFSGMLAAAALIIPGISGSFVLLLLGVYPLVTDSLSSARVLLADITNAGLFLSIIKVLGPLAVGIIIGGLSMARLIEKLLKDHYKTVYLIILGLVTGSVYALFNDPIIYQSGISPIIVLTGLPTISAGAAISYMLGKKRL